MEERHGASGDVESWSRREYSTRAVPARRVLVVSIPPANARIATVLAECDLEFAATAATAVAEARARAFHCALVSVITPDAFDVAKALHEAAPELPVICVRVVDERHRLTRDARRPAACRGRSRRSRLRRLLRFSRRRARPRRGSRRDRHALLRLGLW